MTDTEVLQKIQAHIQRNLKCRDRLYICILVCAFTDDELQRIKLRNLVRASIGNMPTLERWLFTFTGVEMGAQDGNAYRVQHLEQLIGAMK